LGCAIVAATKIARARPALDRTATGTGIQSMYQCKI